MTPVDRLMIWAALAASPMANVAAQSALWARQVGTTADEDSVEIAVDGSGNAYVTGWTNGALGGPNAGGSDYYLAKYDQSGTRLWLRQAGTSAADIAISLAVDGSGNAFVTGFTEGNLGGPNSGLSDAFLAKYDPSGTLLWTRQTGTAAEDWSTGIGLDQAGNAYLTGYTGGSLGGPNAGLDDAFLAKYDAEGNQVWIRQLGTSAAEDGNSVAVDTAGSAYLIGWTSGGLAGPNAGLVDAFMARYDSSGTLLWTRQIGTTGKDYGYSVALDNAGNPYFSGYTDGSLFGTTNGNIDVFLAKYDATGTALWTRQIGTAAPDFGYGLATDSAGNPYICGATQGSLGGATAGGLDAFLAKYSTSGNQLWARHMGTPEAEQWNGIAVDASGGVFVTGNTGGSLAGAKAGKNDIFLAKYAPPPCPADFNHDGFVTGDDFDSFSLAFINGDNTADFDHNGFVTGDDFDAYVAAFQAGC